MTNKSASLRIYNLFQQGVWIPYRCDLLKTLLCFLQQMNKAGLIEALSIYTHTVELYDVFFTVVSSASHIFKHFEADSFISLMILTLSLTTIAFRLAVELARSEGLQIETVVVADDCALIDQGLHAGRRGLAGTVLVHKVAGAAAEAGLDLAQVKRIAQLAAESIGTVGVGFSACTLPSTGLPAFHMKDDEMEVGLGIHGEPGVERVPRCSVKDLVPKILDPILKSKPFSSATDIALFVNNLGTSTTLELYNLSGHAISYLSDRGYSVKKVMVGSFLTSLDMNGVSVTLMVLTSPELIKYLEAPVEILTPWSMIDRVDCDVEFKSICINYATEIESKTRASHEHHHHEQIAQANQMLQQCLEAVCLDLQSYSDQLTELDSQVGDGDLGTNISNLVEGLSAACESLCVLPAAEFMKRVGLQCRGMGGSCGALLGIMFVAMGNSYQTLEGSERRKWIHALKVGIETMKTVGDTHEGDCTMVDALMPALRILEKYTHSDEPEQLPRILEIAATASLDGAETTRDLIAKRGRASYLGSRSLGVMDPGALAVSVVFASISRVFAEACGAGADCD
eukprot:TRINITY_DN3891_c0_g1_i5.p1 TRINITY_DN3891_c0_g1~~TRINITY_DN3891_c0_g1_i5.p1  ORF type:complete len:569 (-),score=99.30 TRINITY_DN3891_c0_g1_i5:178-1884(-)